MSNKCGFCFKDSVLKCGRCKKIFYCSKEHQKSHWKIHKKQCVETPSSSQGAENTESKVQVPEASSWANGLGEKQYEWFVDCYRMRVDDMYAYGGDLVGLYDHPSSKISILRHFWVFCKLAVSQKAIPSNWNWSKVLKAAKGLLTYAFEKSDAQDKYGNENFFSAILGGRSLRYTARVIYGTDVTSPLSSINESSATVSKVLEGISEKFHSHRQFFASEETFLNIGGINAWRDLYKNMEFQSTSYLQ